MELAIGSRRASTCPCIAWPARSADLQWIQVRTLFVKPDAANLAYNFNKTWAIAAEEYDDFGPVRRFYSPSQQQHQLFGVFDFGGRPWSVEGGFGVGLTGASDHLVLKLILSRDLAW